jgi:Family of unknown function (DUF5682)
MTTTATRLHLFGIRHHGPGSALSLVAALDAADPAVVLIEGPPDADEVIRFAGLGTMHPPVALLVHAETDASLANFYPFATYSPEWQAMQWALARSRPVRFIDLPAMYGLAERAEAKTAVEKAEDQIKATKPLKSTPRRSTQTHRAQRNQPACTCPSAATHSAIWLTLPVTPMANPGGMR